MKISTTISLAAVALISATAVAQHLPYHGDGHVIITAESLEWRDVPSMETGAKISVLEGNLAKAKPFTFRLKLPADYRLAPHIHPAYERVTVLQGELHFAHGRQFDRGATTAMPVGGFAVMAPGEPMFGYTTEETIIQLHGTGPWGIEYLDPADDPRKR
ncbi:MAG: cupin domain-containing protein [Gammaproteobacteria bacterium]